MKISIYPPYGFSEIGKRENNEDALFPSLDNANEEYNLFVVCDGVGGSEKGEIASQLAVESVSDYLLTIPQNSVDETSIQSAINHTLEKFDEAINSDESLTKMATTLTLLFHNEKGILLSHIGDSRIYHLRNEKIIYKSKDHTLINQLLEQEIITEEEALNSKKNQLVRFISSANKKFAKAYTYLQTDLENEDYFLLCSDGVIETITDENLIIILDNKEKSNYDKITEIRNLCHQNNTKDNYSAYLVQLKSIDKN
jgi:protein phosphatase